MRKDAKNTDSLVDYLCKSLVSPTCLARNDCFPRWVVWWAEAAIFKSVALKRQIGREREGGLPSPTSLSPPSCYACFFVLMKN